MTWKHVALIAIAAVVVVACEISSVCHDSLGQVIGFSLAVAGIAGGNAMRSEERLPPKKDPP